MRRTPAKLTVLIGACAIIGGSPPSSSAMAAPIAGVRPAAPPLDPSGVYRRTDPANGTLTIRRDGKEWRLSIAAAGLPNGPGTAADCVLEAIGPFANGRLAGRLVPFVGTVAEITAGDLGPAPGAIDVVVKADHAIVTERDASSKLCGMGSDLTGIYRRAR